jgi:hypothetical protein
MSDVSLTTSKIILAESTANQDQANINAMIEAMNQLVPVNAIKLIGRLKSFPDHRGRPGLQGGSLPADAVQDSLPGELTSYHDMPDNLYKSYLVTGDGRLAHMPTEHALYPHESGHPELFGMTAQEAQSFYDQYEKSGGTANLDNYWQKFFSTGTIRLLEYGGELDIETAKLDKATLQRIQRLVDEDKIVLKNKIVWTSVDTRIWNSFTPEEFMSAKYVKIDDRYNLILKSFPGHRGILGHQGGSLPRAKYNVSIGLVQDVHKVGWSIDSIQNASTIMADYNTIAVGIVSREIIGTYAIISHNYMLDKVSYANVDKFVRFNVNRQTNSLDADINYAGIVIRDAEDKVAALNNIYKACDSLISAGLSEDTKLMIDYDDGTPILTSVHKELKSKARGTLKSFPDHQGIPGHQGGSLPRDESAIGTKYAAINERLAKCVPNARIVDNLDEIKGGTGTGYWITPDSRIIDYTTSPDGVNDHLGFLAALKKSKDGRALMQELFGIKAVGGMNAMGEAALKAGAVRVVGSGNVVVYSLDNRRLHDIQNLFLDNKIQPYTYFGGGSNHTEVTVMSFSDEASTPNAIPYADFMDMKRVTIDGRWIELKSIKKLVGTLKPMPKP